MDAVEAKADPIEQHHTARNVEVVDLVRKAFEARTNVRLEGVVAASQAKRDLLRRALSVRPAQNQVIS